MAAPGPVRTADPRRRCLGELVEFLRFPSVSAQPRHAADVARCATWLARHLRAIGMDQVAVEPTPSHPVVTASWRGAPGRSTVLVYGHYDVQPAEPLPAWRSPPFEPQVREDNLHGRGASDDKGQLFAHVKALERLLGATGRLPVNVVCLFEGAEEIGSPGLADVLRGHPLVRAADMAVVSDSAIPAPDRPAVTTSLRGSLSLEVDVAGPGHDLHSGTFGGAVHNPLHALCDLISSLHDRDGRVAVDGFYDRVRTQDFCRLASRPPSDPEVLALCGADEGWGEPGYSLFERTTVRPALNVNGIVGGYQGPGVKAVIPARASAKLNVRLVPDQEPAEVDRLLRRHLARAAPTTVEVGVRTMLAARPAVIDVSHPVVRCAAEAYRRVFGAPVERRPSGGTVPVVALLQEEFDIPTALMGFGLPDDRIHAPNEKLHLPTFFRAIDTSATFLTLLGAGAAR